MLVLTRTHQTVLNGTQRRRPWTAVRGVALDPSRAQESILCFRAHAALSQRRARFARLRYNRRAPCQPSPTTCRSTQIPKQIALSPLSLSLGLPSLADSPIPVHSLCASHSLPTSPRRVCRWPLAGALEHAAHVLTCALLGAAVVSSAISAIPTPTLPALPASRVACRVSSPSPLLLCPLSVLFVPACVASSGVVAPRWHRLHRSIHPKANCAIIEL